MSMRDALAGLKQGQDVPAQIDLEAVTGEPTQKAPAKPKALKKATTRTTGKSSNPDYEKAGVYVRIELRRKAERKWEDETGGDLSDLIEMLLKRYTG